MSKVDLKNQFSTSTRPGAELAVILFTLSPLCPFRLGNHCRLELLSPLKAASHIKCEVRRIENP